MLYIIEHDLSMVKNHLKIWNSRIQIRIFTKIEWIRRGHTPNLSTKFHPNASTTFWDIVLYISLALSLNGEESLKKLNNPRIQIRIRIFPKIESLLPCHTPNMSTKFHRNPSTTFWDIVLYISLALSLNVEESLKKIIGSGFGSSPKLNQFFLVTHPTYPQNFICIRQQLSEISCTQTAKQTDRKGVKT